MVEFELLGLRIGSIVLKVLSSITLACPISQVAKIITSKVPLGKAQDILPDQKLIRTSVMLVTFLEAILEEHEVC